MRLQRLATLATSAVALGVAVLLIGGEIRTWQVQHSPQQKRFLAGRLPSPAPRLFYAGSVPGLQGISWQGKWFNPDRANGINIFLSQGKGTAHYPFRTSAAAGARDSQMQVLRIDYNNSSNPWWLRLFLDEAVAIAPGYLLGKLSLRLVPGRPYQITFFELRQDPARYRPEPGPPSLD